MGAAIRVVSKFNLTQLFRCILFYSFRKRDLSGCASCVVLSINTTITSNDKVPEVFCLSN
jgi:hypothetical protein